MSFIKYFCRGRCSAETLHEIENTDTSNAKFNVAKLQCIKCTHPPFVVEYKKDEAEPNRLSPRTGGMLIDDEQQPCDLC